MSTADPSPPDIEADPLPMKASLKLEYSLRVLAQLARRNKGGAATCQRVSDNNLTN